jgi:hypothetical protein
MRKQFVTRRGPSRYAEQRIEPIFEEWKSMSQIVTLAVVVVANTTTTPPTQGTGGGIAFGCDQNDPNGTQMCQSAKFIAANNAVRNANAASPSDCVLIASACVCQDLNLPLPTGIDTPEIRKLLGEVAKSPASRQAD